MRTSNASHVAVNKRQRGAIQPPIAILMRSTVPRQRKRFDIRGRWSSIDQPACPGCYHLAIFRVKRVEYCVDNGRQQQQRAGHTPDQAFMVVFSLMGALPIRHGMFHFGLVVVQDKA